jgi:hypothetical protein
MTMPLLVGLTLAFGLAAFAARVGFDRDRSYYSVLLIVVASYYVLFAAMAGRHDAVALEAAVTAVFVTAAAIGVRTTPWLVTAGLAAHGMFDAVHGHVIANPGVPAWWPPFCGAFDVAAAACHGWVTWQRGDWRRWAALAPPLPR